MLLTHFEALPDEDLPGLSVVIAARDEEHVVKRALESLLELDYPDLEVVFVDDRSSDRTGEIARELTENHQSGHKLKVLSCKRLPPHWLGKMHALHLGIESTTKPLILLTDADVVFGSQSLRIAASAQRVLDADHLVVAPHIETRGFWEPALVGLFLIMFAARFQPTRVHRERKKFVGVGAFNLLTRQAMERCESLEPLRMQVIDDVHLGRLVKSRGLNQFCLIADDYIKVRWIEGLWGCIKGLEKNAYAGMNYSLPFSMFSILMVCSPLWFPLLLVWLGHAGWALGYLFFCFLLGLLIPRSCRIPRWVGLTFPLTSVVLAFTFLRSVWLAEKRQGVEWRGTVYPLKELRKAHNRFVTEVAPL